MATRRRLRTSDDGAPARLFATDSASAGQRSALQLSITTSACLRETVRLVFLAGVTAHPIGPWVTQQARNLVATLEDQGRALRSLVRDRDAKFVGPFDEVLRSTGARVIKTPVRSPRANAFAERFVRTARAECLDWVMVWSERHLDRVVRDFVAHYNHERPHRGLHLEVPVPYLSDHQFNGVGRIKRAERLGGLIHEYSVAARLFTRSALPSAPSWLSALDAPAPRLSMLQCGFGSPSKHYRPAGLPHLGPPPEMSSFRTSNSPL